MSVDTSSRMASWPVDGSTRYGPPYWLQPPLPLTRPASNVAVGTDPGTGGRPSTDLTIQEVPARADAAPADGDRDERDEPTEDHSG